MCAIARSVRLHEHVEIDEAMSLALVIFGDAREHRKLVADACGGKIPHRAADMNPGSEHHVLHQCLIAEAQHDAGMREIFFGIERVGFAHVAEILRRVFGGDPRRMNAEPGAFRERALVRRRTHGRRQRLSGTIELRLAPRRPVERCRSVRADRALALDPDGERVAIGGGGNFHDLAVIDG